MADWVPRVQYVTDKADLWQEEVPIVDTQVANYLIQMMQAATLLGCQSILVGISPEIAQTVVQLGVNLSAIRTAPTMQRGLEIALMSLGYPVQRPGKGG